MKKKRIKYKKTKFNFIQHWGTYNIETLVSVGTNYNEVLDCIKRLKFKKENIQAIKEDKEVPSFIERKPACFLGMPSGNILHFKGFKDEWYFYEWLIHELFHAVYIELGKNSSMIKEEEAMAYQIEFLFREIRRKLQNHYKR